MSAVTQWFDGYRQPSKPGYYQVRSSEKSEITTTTQYWNGGIWLTNDKSMQSIFGLLASHQWRGLAENPNKKENK